MLTEPGDLDRGELRAVLERHWGLATAQLEYMPVGFGSHHWQAIDSDGLQRFVTVDDLQAGFQAGSDTGAAFAVLERALGTAAWLRNEAELEFVVAPLADAEGIVVRRLSDRYAVSVFPLIAGETSPWGPYESAGDRREMGLILGRLHATTPKVPAGLPRRDDLAVSARAALVEALTGLDRPWPSGPFAEPTRRLLQANAGDLERGLHEYDALAAAVGESPERWVITHGEPHRANVIREPRGGVHLVDWDRTLIAPRERDLWMVLDENLTGWDEYVSAAGDAILNEEAIELYRRRWDLADIAIFVDLFRRDHVRTDDTVKSWDALTGYLPASG